MTIERNVDLSYSTCELIEDLRKELKLHSEILADLFPARVKCYKDYWLSELWGYSKKYVFTLKDSLKKNPNKQIYALQKLEKKLEEELDIKCLSCKNLIKAYKEGKFSGLQFLEYIRNELGRISGKISLTFEELGYIVVGSARYITGIWDKLNYPRNVQYNSNYKISFERLNQFQENLSIILGEKAQKCLEMIELYKKSNKDLKFTKNQQYTIKNPNFFKKLNRSEVLYWLGFLCADGYLIHKIRRIGMELSIKDRDILEKFTRALGLTLDRIKVRIKNTIDQFGKITRNKMCYINFICGPIYNDLISYGIREATSKTDPKIKRIPQVIYDLISEALLEVSQGKFLLKDSRFLRLTKERKWYYTFSGRLVLAWLLGFYDGDGHYHGGRSAMIGSSSKSFLKEIKEAFMIKNPVRSYNNSKSISLGPRLFDALMWSYSNSMRRKRLLNE